MEDYTIPKFDRDCAGLLGGNNLTTKATTVEHIGFAGAAETFIVQTVRDQKGDYVLLKYNEGDALRKVILPPRVCSTIARHRDTLTAQSRRNAGRAQAKARKDRGERLRIINTHLPLHRASRWHGLLCQP